jgi:NAD(P)-dependent dehydrogenase (short-subunit alcohol dehydrogenase family)
MAARSLRRPVRTKRGGEDPLFAVRDKVVVVTGACGGIGRALCRGFVGRGATVVAVDKVAGRAPRGTEFHRVDIGDRSQVRAFGAKVARDHGRVDVLVNNAGTDSWGKAEDFTDEAWDRVIAVNLTGTFTMAQTFGRLMIERGRGKIVNVASACGMFGYPFVVSYNASKAGIWSMTQTLAVEWGIHGIQVNAVIPGFVVTPLNRSTLDDPETLEINRRIIPNGKLSRPEDLVGPILFLASKAADYVSGCLFVVDAGTVAGGGIGPVLRDDGLAKVFAVATR